MTLLYCLCAKGRYMHTIWSESMLSHAFCHIQLFRERLSEKNHVHTTIPKGNMGYDRYTVPGDCSCRTYFCCFPLALANTFSWPFVPILSIFSEEQWIQNHPQCLSGLSRAIFPTTFLEIAVYLYLLIVYGPLFFIFVFLFPDFTNMCKNRI